MLKYRPFVLLAMLLFVLFFACQDDKIIDPPGPTTQGFPNTVGSWYRFDVTRVVSGFTTRDTLTINVTGLKQISADRIAKVWRYGDGPDVDSFFVTESADTVFFFTGRDSDPVTFIMPLRVGNSWHRAAGLPDSNIVVDTALWSLLPGAFQKAYNVERRWDQAGFHDLDGFWIIPDIGIVSMELRTNATDPEKDVNETWRLLSYFIQD